MSEEDSAFALHLPDHCSAVSPLALTYALATLACPALFPAAPGFHAAEDAQHGTLLTLFPRSHSFIFPPAGVHFEGSNEVGVFARLTNSYCLVSLGGSQNFYSVFESELAAHVPVIHASIAGCRFVGRVTSGEWPL